MSWDLIADIGGTNARFAAVIDGAITDIETYPTKGEDGLIEAMSAYIKDHHTSPERVMLAAAGVVRNGMVRLTNAEKDISIEATRKLTGAQSLWFLNDFEAAAWSLASVQAQDVTRISGPETFTDANRLIIGPGTGLGVGSLLKTYSGYHAVAGEGGHVSIAPATAQEVEIFKALRHTWPQTQFGKDGLVFEAEVALSGTGLPRLYDAACMAAGLSPANLTAKRVLELAKEGDALGLETLTIFKTHLGRVAGDLALAVLAYGGVFLTGGVLLKNQWLIDETLIKAYEQGGRHTKFRQAMPLYLYQNEQFGLHGAANALRYIGA